jgi:hypothetical protein
MQLIMSLTSVNGMDCITFIDQSDEEDYVGIYKGNGCHSDVSYNN